MSIQSTARRLVDLCNQGKNFDVMHTMYAPDIVSVEGDGAETAGQGPVIKKSETWQGNNEIHSEKVRGPYFNGPDQFAVHFTFEITPKRTGERVTIEEVGVYTVKATRSRASNSSTMVSTEPASRTVSYSTLAFLDSDDLGRNEGRQVGPRPGEGAVVHHCSGEADFDGLPGDELPPREAVKRKLDEEAPARREQFAG